MKHLRQRRSYFAFGGNWWWGAMGVVLFAAPLWPFLSASAEAAGLHRFPVPVVGVDAFGLGAGQLGSPGALVVDSQRDVLVADQAKNHVVEYAFDAVRSSYRKVGAIAAGVGGRGSGSTQLDYPDGVALDARGDLFVADAGNNRVQEFAYSGATATFASMATTVAGVGGLGAGLTQLNGPSGLAFDARGDLLVADTSNNRVLEYAYSSVTGTFASAGIVVAGAGEGGAAPSQLHYPHSITVDGKGDLFILFMTGVGDSRVAEYSYNAMTDTYGAATIVVAAPPNMGQAVTLDAAGDLFMSYEYLGYGGVLEYAYNAVAGTFAKNAVPVDPVAVVGPIGIAFDAHGDLFVSETEQTSNPSHTVWDMVLELDYTAATGTFAPAGTVLGQVGRTNYGIEAVALDAAGDLFVADMVNSSGIEEFAFDAATGTYSPLGQSIGTVSAQLAVDSAGDVFIAAPRNAAGVVECRRKPGTDSYPATGEAVPGATQLSKFVPGALALDQANDLFVAKGTRVLEFAYHPATGTYAAVGTIVAGVGGKGKGTRQLAGVGGLAFDTNGDLFVSDPPNARVQEFTLNPTTGKYAANGVTVAGSGGAGRGLNQLSAPDTSGDPGVGGVAVDGGGDLFVYDTGNYRVMEYAHTDRFPKNGTVVWNDVSGNNSAERGGVAVDGQGDLFVDSNMNSAVVYELTTSTPAPTLRKAGPLNRDLSAATGTRSR